jgi:hypothetical protein
VEPQTLGYQEDQGHYQIFPGGQPENCLTCFKTFKAILQKTLENSGWKNRLQMLQNFIVNIFRSCLYFDFFKNEERGGEMSGSAPLRQRR